MMLHNFLQTTLVLIFTLAIYNTSHAAPVNDLTKVVLGSSHGCGITQAGALRCFGNNGDGQVGTAQKLPYSFARRAVKVLPAGVTDVAISDGPVKNHTCAVVNSALFCWGSNGQGQLGMGKAGDNIRTPTKSSAVTGVVKSVAVASSTTCVILAPDGALQCWGNNYNGKVGSGSTVETILQPVTVIPSGVTSVAIGGQHTCAVVDGGLQCWGFLLFKDNELKTLYNPISIIPAGQGVTAVAAALHTCVIVKDSLQCWGRNFHDQVGVPEGSRVAPTVPTTIAASGVSTMALSAENTCAVVNGVLKCWGRNYRGQLGTPNSQGSRVPEAVSVPGTPPASIRAIAIGMGQVCVLSSVAADGNSSLLQCTNRSPEPEDVDDTEPSSPGQWQVFGTEGVGLSEPPPILPRIAHYGLWQGTIGTQNVTVKLAPTKQACDAQYYYHKHLFSIPLVEKERRQGRTWKESPVTDQEATWTFSDLSADRRNLNGEWVSRDGQRRLPIRLSLLALMSVSDRKDWETQYDCYTHEKAFDAPRITRAMQERKVAGSDTAFKGADGTYRYRNVSVLGEHIRGFSLADSSNNPGLLKMLGNWERDNVAGYYSCALGFAGRSEDTSPDFNVELSPVFWNARLLVLQETYSNYCGGAHPNGGVSGFRVWDLQEDRPVEIWKWIRGGDKTSLISSKRLLKLLAARYSRRNETEDNSCSAALEGQDYYLMHPTAIGMVFSPSLPHVIQACAEDIEIPWIEMQPFLTTSGQKALQLFMNVH